MSDADWTRITGHYERRLAEAGATPQGVDWPNGQDLEARFAVQLSLLDGVPAGHRPALLDLGCGPGLLLDYLAATGRAGAVDYAGIDLSPAMVEAARRRWPEARFAARDIVAEPLAPLSVDVVLMNGVLTERLGLPQETMEAMAQGLIRAAFDAARVGIAFNVMSDHVDWHRDDLFHWPFDDVARFLTRAVSRHYTLRADYGLYEYTIFVWRAPQRPAPLNPGTWWQR